jgi:hypothetical protein
VRLAHGIAAGWPNYTVQVQDIKLVIPRQVLNGPWYEGPCVVKLSLPNGVTCICGKRVACKAANLSAFLLKQRLGTEPSSFGSEMLWAKDPNPAKRLPLFLNSTYRQTLLRPNVDTSFAALSVVPVGQMLPHSQRS